MFITGLDVLDADHARIATLWVEFRQHLERNDLDTASRICHDGLHFCLEHWTKEEAMLTMTDWPLIILQGHVDDHHRLEHRMVRALTCLQEAGRIADSDLALFENDLIHHMATYDLSLVERVCRGPDRFYRWWQS